MANPLSSAIYALPPSDHKQFKYLQYNNLVYLAVTGMTAKELRKARGFNHKGSASLLLTYPEREQVKKMEIRVAELIRQRKSYQQIKEIVMPKIDDGGKTDGRE